LSLLPYSAAAARPPPDRPSSLTWQFNLSDFTRRAYGTNYIETLRVQIHANCRIRRIYFSDRCDGRATPRSRTAVEPHASRSTRAPAPAPFASVTASFALPNPQPWHVRDASSAQALLRGGAAAGVQALPANPGVARSPERLLRPGARSHASPPSSYLHRSRRRRSRSRARRRHNENPLLCAALPLTRAERGVGREP